MNPMLVRLRERRDALVQTNTDLLTRAASEDRDELSESEQVSFDEANGEIERLNARIADLEALEARNAVAAALSVATDETLQRNGVRVERVEDPLIYRADGEHDPIRDLLLAANEDSDARERLARHRAQAVAADQFLQRASATGDLGGLVVTEYLLSEFAEIRREGRPFANICRNLPLTTFSRIIGKQTDGAVMGTPTGSGPTYGENQDYPTDDIESDPITVSAKTIAGYVEASVESVDFGVLDTTLVWQDVISAYFQMLDTRLIHGSGTNAQHLGVLATPNIGGLSYSGPAITEAQDHFQVMHSLVLQAAGQVQSAVKRPATHVVMSSLRWYSLASATDLDGRPLLGFAGSAPSNVAGQFEGRGFAGLPVVVDDNLVSGSDTKVLVVRAPELLLWERNGGAPATIRVDQAKATKGIVQFIGRGYSAFTGERYPDAVNVIDTLPTPVFDAPTGS